MIKAFRTLCSLIVLTTFSAWDTQSEALECAPEIREIARYPVEYATEFDEGQLIRLQSIAATIIRSHDTHSPITNIKIVGHADIALKVPINARAAKEQSVSEERAKNARTSLLTKLKSMANGESVITKIAIDPVIGMGAKELKKMSPANEVERQKNRRVEFHWMRCSGAVVHPLPTMPPPELHDVDDKPGQHFRMKILDGVSAGEVGGVFSYAFILWDVDNMRAAEYHYKGIITTVGIPPFTECGESDWSEIFDTNTPLHVYQFSGEGAHVSGSLALLSGMRYTFVSFKDVRSLPIGGVNIFQGPAKSLSAEVGRGSTKLIPGSTISFKGP